MRISNSEWPNYAFSWATPFFEVVDLAPRRTRASGQKQLAMLEQIQRRGQYHGRINYENNHAQ